MKVLDIALKDLLRSFRSLFAIGMMIAVPLLLTGMIYFAFGGLSSGSADLPTLKLVVVNQDAPPAGQPALGQMLADMFSDPSVSGWLQASQMDSEQAARAAVDSRKAGAAVIIPSDLSKSLLAGESRANILLVQDPTLSTGPLVVKNMITSFLDGITGAQIALQVSAARAQQAPVALSASDQLSLVNAYQQWFTGFQRQLYHSPQSALVMKTPVAQGSDPADENPLGRIMSLIMAGQMIFFGFYTGAYSMMSILKEDEEGTLGRLFTTPTGHTSILAGKFLAVFLAVTIQSLVLIAAGRLAFGVQWGQPASIALAIISQVVAATGLGVLLISGVKNTRQAGFVIGGALTTLGMLGGLFTVGVQTMPAAFNLIARFTPHGWALLNWKAAMAGGAISELLLPSLVLLAMGAAMFAAGAIIFRRRFA